MRPFGAVQIVNNVGDRKESDWDAIKAALGAGNVCIMLSNYEADVLPQYLQGNLPCGGNVRFETKRVPNWKLVEEGPFCHLADVEWQCEHCGEDFPSKFHMVGHVQRAHRHLVEREMVAAGE